MQASKMLKRTMQKSRVQSVSGTLGSLSRLLFILLAIALGLGIVGQSAYADSADSEREKQLEQVIKERIEGDNCNAPAPYDDSPYIDLMEYHAVEFGEKFDLTLFRKQRYQHCYHGIANSAVFAARAYNGNQLAKRDDNQFVYENSSYEFVLDYFKEKTVDGYASARNDQDGLIESSPIYQLEKQILDISYTPEMGALFKANSTNEDSDTNPFDQEIRKRLYCKCMAIPAEEFRHD